jgi:hypothetical protein
MPEIGYGYNYGSGAYLNGQYHDNGYYLFDSHGVNDQTKGFSSGADAGTINTHWIGGLRKIWWLYYASLKAWNFDPLVGGSTKTATHDLVKNYVLPDILYGGPGCLIPDPNDPGDSAYVMWQDGGMSLPGGPGVCYLPKVGSGATGQISSRISGLSNVPSNIAWKQKGSQLSTWFDYAGNYKSGSTRILTWPWACTSDGLHGDLQGDGIRLLDTSNWTYASDPLPNSAPPLTSIASANGLRNIFVLADYVSHGNYLPVCVIGCIPDAVTSAVGQVWIYKIPWMNL